MIINLVNSKKKDIKKYTIIIPSGTSNPVSKNISWSGDAGTLTETERENLIKEHSHPAVVYWDGTKPDVKYYLYRNNLNYKATDSTCDVSSGEASVLTGEDGDAMVLYDQVWWTVTKVGDAWHITFTWENPAGLEGTWVSPHTYGDSLTDTSLAQYTGLGIFEASVIDEQMRSINTSSTPTGSVTHNNFYNAAIKNRNWQYNNMLPMTWAWYIIQLYFVKGDRDCQNAYGNGYCSGSSKKACNINWDATKWINGTTANKTSGVTALYVHNPWGNSYTFMGETRNDGGTIKFSVLGGKDHYNIESGTASTWKSVSITTSSGCTTEIDGTCIEFPFMATSVSGTDFSKFYADRFYGSASSGLAVDVGGYYGLGLACGPLNVYPQYGASYKYSYLAARLHVMII